MARFCTLFSSSSGNSTYVGTSSYGVLIDAGTNNKQLLLSMSRAEISPESVKAVFVTHEHSDHTGALRVFASKMHVPVYATGGTLSGLMNAGILDGKFPFEKLPSDGIDVGDMHVGYFHTSHDSKESCGFRIELPDRTVGIATDTGLMTGEVFRGLSGCDMVLIESNYDPDMLDFGPYPLPLKARIRSESGHLSNPDCADAVCSLLDTGVRRFVLGHLSRENNTPEKAYAEVHSALIRRGAEDGKDFLLSVAPVSNSSKYISF